MARKENFNEFNLNSNEFESDERFTVTISSESDFDDDNDKKKAANRRKAKIFLKAASESSLEKISSDEEDINTADSSQWYTVAIKLQNDEKTLPNIANCSMKHLILDTILKNAEPFQIVPHLYSELHGFYSFHVFDCEDALNKLRSQDYVCTSDVIPNFSFKLQITSNNTKKSNVFSLIKATLKKRHNKIKKSLDLSDFVNEKFLQKTFYMPLWYVGNQTMIVSKIKDFIDPKSIEELNLSSNSIYDFEGFNLAVIFSNLKKLDISKNKIPNIKGLIPFRGLIIKVCNLQFNPICHNYIDRKEYIKSVKLIFPTIEILDQNNISCMLPRAFRNYTVDGENTQLVDRFMTIYFTLFDSDDRSAMIHLYSKNALFSINCVKTDATFHKKARNLIVSNNSNIYVGPRSIIGCLCWIPPTEHIPSTFSVDVIFTKLDELLIINISGTLLLTSNFRNRKQYSFMRTFVIMREENEYKICNDMLFLRCVPSANLPKDPDAGNKIIDLTPSEPLSQHTKNEMIDIFMTLTKMNRPIAEDCLAKSKWNFRDATSLAINILKKPPC